METKRKIPFSFAVFGILVVGFSHLRTYFDLFPSKSLDSLIWFLCGPVIKLQMAFNLPGSSAAPLTLIYYLFVGFMFEKVLRFKKRQLILFIAILFLILLHYLTAVSAQRNLAELLSAITRLFRFR